MNPPPYPKKARGLSNQGKPRKPLPIPTPSPGSQPSANQIFNLLMEEQAKTPLQDMVVSLDSPACNSAIVTLRQTSNIEEASAHFLGSRCVVLGKVSGQIEADTSIPLYRRSILAVMGEEVTRPFFASLAQFDVDLANLSVEGPAVQILPVAIYV